MTTSSESLLANRIATEALQRISQVLGRYTPASAGDVAAGIARHALAEMEGVTMEELDRDEILRLFGKRLDAINEDDRTMRCYWEGRIDGHCLQNAIDEDELIALAAKHGFRVEWDTAMAVAGA